MKNSASDRSRIRSATSARGPVLVFVFATAIGGVGVACTESFPSCKTGEFRACNCAGGGAGYQQCLASEADYGACVCDGRTPGLVQLPTGDKGFLAACTTGAECQSGICGSFPSRGDKCTIACTSNDECAAPSPGCNPQRICRSP